MQPSDTDLLRAYLADRDAACPRCRYNLRGVQESTCPECGGPVALGIGDSTGARAARLLAAAVLLWVAIASGMGAARSARAALEESQVSNGVQVRFAGGGSIQFGGGGGGVVMRSFTTATPGQRVVINGQAITTTTTPRGPRDWSQVGWQTWAALGWGSVLGLAALIGLFLLWWRRGRVAQRPRPWVAAAVSLAALHLAVQVVLFVRELSA
jgi:hypothetical protein